MTDGSPRDPELPAGRQRTFSAFLIEQRGGSLHGELTERLAEVVSAALEHGEQGSLVLKVAVKPNKDGITVTVTDEVRCKVPEGDRGAALFYADEAGNLTRRDPRQPELPLKEVPSDNPDLREVS